jgi:formylglycine-generating enzyme required for sulfatase activity
VIDPTGPSSGSDRVIRGGGWFLVAGNCRSAFRDNVTPGSRDYNLGFRLLRTAQ